MAPPTEEQQRKAEELRVLMKRSKEEFDAMTPEQQRELRAAQRRSWLIGETMLENPNMTREQAEALADKCLRDAGYL